MSHVDMSNHAPDDDVDYDTEDDDALEGDTDDEKDDAATSDDDDSDETM